MGKKKIIINVSEKYSFKYNGFGDECTVDFGPFEGPNLSKDEYPHLYLDHEITDEELDNAINVITTALMQKGTHTIIADLDVREKLATPIKEMTVEDIEKALGYKVKIIGGDK